MKTHSQALQSRIGSSLEHAKTIALMPSAPLTPEQQEKYAACKERVRKGMATFMDVADALFTVRDDWLYRDEYPTFEKCCQAEFGISARRARQLCDAAEVRNMIAPPHEGRAPTVPENGNHGSQMDVPPYDLADPEVEMRFDGAVQFLVKRGRTDGAISALHSNFGWPVSLAQRVFDAIVDRGLVQDSKIVVQAGAATEVRPPLPLPESERVARPLTKLPKEEVPEVWKRAVETAPDGKPPTGAHVEKVVQEHLRPKIEEVEFSRLQKRGDIAEANCSELFWQGPNKAVTLGNGNVFEHDRCNWVTLSMTMGPGMGDCSAECYCLVDAERYTGPDGKKDSVSYQGYRVVLNRENYRLGPKTIFRAPAVPVPTKGKSEQKGTEQTEDEAWAIGIPAKAPLPTKSKSAEASAKPEVLEMAKRIYLIGCNAAGMTKKWGTASLETHVAFLAVAQWHLEEMAELLQSFGSKVAKPSLSLSAAAKTKIAAVARARWKKAKALASPKGKKDFVIVREVKGSKPKFWAGPNAWTVDPHKAKHLSSAAAIMRLRGTQKFESCKADRMLALGKAVDLAAK